MGLANGRKREKNFVTQVEESLGGEEKGVVRKVSKGKKNMSTAEVSGGAREGGERLLRRGGREGITGRERSPGLRKRSTRISLSPQEKRGSLSGGRRRRALDEGDLCGEVSVGWREGKVR